ncbi:MAG TPA: hypothetical protein VGE47_11330 [Burkholderiaceae bacterium]
MSAIFSWKPSLVGPRYEVRVDSAGAEATRGSKTRKVRFSSVTGGRLLELYMRTSSVSLVLMHKGKDGVTKFVINHGGRVSDASYDENAAAFVAASAEILEYLAKARPETQISLGGGTGVRATMAMLGISMAVMGALLVIIPLVQGDVGFEDAMMGLMAVVFAASGVGLAIRYNPFAKLETMSPEDLARLLRSQ